MVSSKKIFYLLCISSFLCASYTSGQVVFTHTLELVDSTIELETDPSSIASWFAREINMSDPIELSFSNAYSFHQFSTTPTGWSFDIAAAEGIVTRTYFYSGIDGENANEFRDFANTFVVDFALLTPDPVSIPTTVDLSYAFTAFSSNLELQTEGFPTPISIPGGVRLLNDGDVIPEPSTYAVILGISSLLPVVWLKLRHRP